MVKNRILTALMIFALILFMLTFCIGLPIYFRPFYYLQIKTLGLEDATGWSYETIKTAYDEVLNFCTLAGREFSAGELEFSESGAAHFADCKVLFDLNLSVMVISAAILICLFILYKVKVFTPCRPLKRHAYFWAAIVALALPLVIGFLAALDFDKAFEVFHAIFFPGKSNWLFNPQEDQIILIMPQEFFMNCAIFIGAGLVAFAGSLIISDAVLLRKEKKKAVKEDNSNNG